MWTLTWNAFKANKKLKLNKGNIGINLYDSGFGNVCLDTCWNLEQQKKKNRLNWLYHNSKLLCFKRYYEKSEKTILRMGAIICKSHIWQGDHIKDIGKTQY